MKPPKTPFFNLFFKILFVLLLYDIYILFSAVNDFIILILLIVSDNFDVFNYFYLLVPAHIALSIIPVNIKIGDKASVIREILQDAKNAKITPVRNELKL